MCQLWFEEFELFGGKAFADLLLAYAVLSMYFTSSIIMVPGYVYVSALRFHDNWIRCSLKSAVFLYLMRYEILWATSNKHWKCWATTTDTLGREEIIRTNLWFLYVGYLFFDGLEALLKPASPPAFSAITRTFRNWLLQNQNSNVWEKILNITPQMDDCLTFIKCSKWLVDLAGPDLFSYLDSIIDCQLLTLSTYIKLTHTHWA